MRTHDIRLMELALRHRLPLSDRAKEGLGRFVEEILNDPEANARERAGAARVGLGMAQHNLRLEALALEHEKPVAPGALHLHAHGADSRLDERLRELDALLAAEKARNAAEPAALPAPAPEAPEVPPQ
jgi:hypothetical protein